ncbi:acyltransferase, partial [Halorubrum sp. E3]
LGEADAADELAEALADGEEVRDPLLVPRGAEISDDAWRVSTPATVGDDCRLHGNLRAESIRTGERNEVFGSLRAREGITVGADTTIHGDVTTRGGTVTVEAGARVLGDVSAGDLVVHDGAEIDGTLRARGEMKLVQETGGGNEDETGGGEESGDEENARVDEGDEIDGDESDSDESGDTAADGTPGKHEGGDENSRSAADSAADSDSDMPGVEGSDDDPGTDEPDADAEAT